MKKIFFIMMTLCTVTMYAQTKESEIQEFEYDGGIYRGEALNGKPHGMGFLTYTSTDPRIKYRGYYVDGKRHGKGLMYWRNGDQYVGNWENGMENGEGECIYANGDKYVGHWKDGEPSGEGICYYANGNKYEGNWEHGLWNGKGCYSKDGHDYRLIWESVIEHSKLIIEGKNEAGGIQISILFAEHHSTEIVGSTELHRSVIRTFKKHVNRSAKDN